MEKIVVVSGKIVGNVSIIKYLDKENKIITLTRELKNRKRLN